MKKFLKPVCSFFILGFISLPLLSQPEIHIPRSVSGRITDSEVHKGISFVHILNESLHISALSDTTGRFTIPAGINDTLVFSVIGYLGRFIILDETAFEIGLEINLSPRYYEIAEVEVFGISTYSRFKEKFLDLDIPVTETDILRYNLEKISLEIGREAKYELAMKKAAEGGNLLAAPILSPEEKQRIKLKEIKSNEIIQMEIDRKYNRQIVADATGLKDRELDEFMLFCKFEPKFLQYSSQYDILVKVFEKYEQFKELKKKSSIQTTDHYANNSKSYRYKESTSVYRKIYS